MFGLSKPVMASLAIFEAYARQNKERDCLDGSRAASFAFRPCIAPLHPGCFRFYDRVSRRLAQLAEALVLQGTLCSWSGKMRQRRGREVDRAGLENDCKSEDPFSTF